MERIEKENRKRDSPFLCPYALPENPRTAIFRRAYPQKPGAIAPAFGGTARALAPFRHSRKPSMAPAPFPRLWRGYNQTPCD